MDVTHTHITRSNYAGIDRSVMLYRTPNPVWITDMNVAHGNLTFDPITNQLAADAQVLITWDITLFGWQTDAAIVSVEMYDPNGGGVVGTGSGYSGYLFLTTPKLWYACGMPDTYPCDGSQLPQLYEFRVSVYLASNPTVKVDSYTLPIGLREITTATDPPGILINNRRVYFHGVNRHEDSDVRGKGFDPSLLIKDYNQLQWMRVNAFRTSHYPYADEQYQMADRLGFMVIDETPAVGMREISYFNADTLQHHYQVVYEMMSRDKHHPSVVIWSMANEPISENPLTASYFEKVISYARQIMTVSSHKRLISFVCNADYTNDQWNQYTDLIMINRYYSWYSNSGHLELIGRQLTNDLNGWHSKYPDRPIMVSEYGSDTIPGLHTSPSRMFSEEWQTDFLAMYQNVFDQFRPSFLFGELIWVYADFATDSSDIRVGNMNMKGLFTRSRQPKMAARMVKARYTMLEGGQSAQSVGTARAPQCSGVHQSASRVVEGVISAEVDV